MSSRWLKVNEFQCHCHIIILIQDTVLIVENSKFPAFSPNVTNALYHEELQFAILHSECLSIIVNSIEQVKSNWRHNIEEETTKYSLPSIYVTLYKSIKPFPSLLTLSVFVSYLVMWLMQKTEMKIYLRIPSWTSRCLCTKLLWNNRKASVMTGCDWQRKKRMMFFIRKKNVSLERLVFLTLYFLTAFVIILQWTHSWIPNFISTISMVVTSVWRFENSTT